MKLLLHFISAFIVVFNVSAQSSDTIQRVKMIRHYYSNSSTFGDSLLFSYSDARASVFDPVSYPVYRGYRVYPAVTDMRVDMPDPLNDVDKMSIHYDTMYRYMITGNAELYEQYYNTFSGNNIAAHYKKTVKGVRSLNKHVYDIDGDGNVKGVYELRTDTAAIKWDTTALGRFAYDSQNRAVADTFQGGIIYASNFVYNQAGQITDRIIFTQSGTGWVYSNHCAYIYDAKGKFVQQIQEAYNPNAPRWDTTANQYIRYDALGRITSSVYKYKPSLMQGDSSIEFSLLYKDASSELADTVVEYGYDLGSVTYCKKTAFFYNKYGNPDSALSYQFSNCDRFAIQDSKTYYAYEVYAEEGDTTITPQPKGKLVVFPNPAGEVIKIRWNEDKPAAAHVYFYNSIGQAVGSTYIAKPQEEDSITLPGLAAGVYYIRINTGGGGHLYSGGIAVH